MGPVHAGLQVLLRQAPMLLIELFVHAGVLPKGVASWRPSLQPTEAVVIRPGLKRRELRADMVLIVAAPEVDTDDPRARKRALQTGRAYSVIFEIQRVVDKDRPDAWADYWTAYRLDLGGEIRLVILTFDPRVARWARLRTARLSPFLQVFVLTPNKCPRWSNVDSEREPERAVLNAVLHARGEAQFDLVHAALAALDTVGDSLAVHYAELLIAQLGRALILNAIAAREQETSTMPSTNLASQYENSPRPHIRLAVEAGEVLARAQVVVEILDHRGVALDPDARARILGCREAEILAQWLGAALRVSSSDELFEA